MAASIATVNTLSVSHFMRRTMFPSAQLINMVAPAGNPDRRSHLKVAENRVKNMAKRQVASCGRNF
jgi:hypothetical protein